MAYYNVEYISPSNNKGIHVAVKANTPEEAGQISPVMLSWGTPWKPEEWNVVSVVLTPEKDIPTSAAPPTADSEKLPPLPTILS